MAGFTSSLKSSFNASARGWPRPVGPTRLGPMRSCMRLMTRRSNHVMYAMPASNARMMTSERTMSITTSDTRDQCLLVHDPGEVRVVLDNASPDRLQGVAARNRHAKPHAELGGDAPVGAGVHRWRGAALLMLHASLEVEHARLALVGVAHRKH